MLVALALAVLLFQAGCARLPVPPSRPATWAPYTSPGGSQTSRWQDAQSWQITYKITRSYRVREGDPPFEMTLSYLPPDRFRAECGGPVPFVAVGDSEASQVYFPEYGFACWMVADDAPRLPTMYITVGGTDGPLAFMRYTQEESLARVQEGDENVSLLPDDLVAGRPCIVIEARWKEGESDGAEAPQDARSVRWVDADLGIALRVEMDHTQYETEYIATDARVGVALDEALFSFDVPEGTVVFRYPLEFHDADAMARALKLPAGRKVRLFSLPGQRRMMPVWSPEYLPPGFTWAVTTVPNAPEPGEDWDMDFLLISSKGGVINVTQGTEEYEVGAEPEGPAKMPEVEAVTINTIFGPRPGHVYRYREPYWQTVVVWGQERKHYWIEGVGVPEEELVKMAESMRKYGLQPRRPSTSKEEGEGKT